MSGYRIAPRVVIQDVLSESVLLDMDRGEYFELNESGSRMLRALDRHGDPETALTSLLDEYEVSRETLSKEFTILIDELHSRGLIEKRPQNP